MLAKRLSWLAAAGLALGTGSASAGIEFYDIFYNIYYTQTAADTAPGAPDLYAAACRVTADTFAEVSSATVTFPDGVTIHEMTSTGSNEFIWFAPAFSSAEAMLADEPLGVYRYDVTTTDQVSLEGQVVPAQTLWSQAVPYFTGSTFDRMTAVDSTQDLVLTFNTFSGTPGTNVSVLFLAAFDQDTGAFVGQSEPLDPAHGSVVIPGGTFEGGRRYGIYLYFSNRLELAHAGLGGATSIAGFDRVTHATLTTLPICRADFNDDGFMDIYDFTDFVTCFEGGDCPPGKSADYNGDGFADIYDFTDFVTDFEAGC